MSGWAIDFGTSNSGVARWDANAGKPAIVELDDIARSPAADDPLLAPRMVPSAVWVPSEDSFADRLGRTSLFQRNFFVGSQGLIGRPALEKNEARALPGFAPLFKPYLAHAPLRTLARAGNRALSARDITRIFARELLASVHRATGERIREVVLSAPVESFEAYRAELVDACKSVGIRRVRFLDEPVAAALGYGLALADPRIVLVMDFGGGTLHFALIRMTARQMAAGESEVLAKVGRPVGGTLVDRWVLEDFCREQGFELNERSADDDLKFWFRMMMREACRVKEAVFVREDEPFYMVPPEDYRAFDRRIANDAPPAVFSRSRLVSILDDNDLYSTIAECLDDIAAQAAARGLRESDIDDVLLVGGSTLLPGIYPRLEERFGRDRVRGYQPFEAVVQGAAVFAAGTTAPSDFIVHDYAFLTHDAQTHEPRHTVIVPRGTRFPTAPDLWKRKVVPTCSRGEAETTFKLVILELGAPKGGDRLFAWDLEGRLHVTGGKAADERGQKTPDGRLVIALNEANPMLGKLDPAHQPTDREPRLEIAFGVNAERWLVAAVRDLKTNRVLLDGQPVVRLL
jgi:molecular chaperone DnaK (HSP70)